ncbi:MAG: hypothetical protein Q9220_005444 [cf. Caloplaca sp. 1 TL-2023]
MNAKITRIPSAPAPSTSSFIPQNKRPKMSSRIKNSFRRRFRRSHSPGPANRTPILRPSISSFISVFSIIDPAVEIHHDDQRRHVINGEEQRPVLNRACWDTLDRGRSRFSRVPMLGYEEDVPEMSPAPSYRERDSPEYELEDGDEWVCFLEHEFAREYTFVRKSWL